MNEAPESKVVRSDEAKEKMRSKARARRDIEIQVTHDRVREIMRLIQHEMAANGGIYPHNKGVVSQAEVVRRAGMHPVSVHQDYYRELREEVKVWLETLKSGGIVGHQRVRKALKDRVEDHKRLYEDLLNAYHLAETDYRAATERVKEIEKENAELRRKLAEAAPLNVVSLKPSKSKKD